VIDGARDVLGRLCRLRALLPGLLFVMFVAAFVGVGAGAGTHSLLLTLASVAAIPATLAALAAWTLVTERNVHHSAELPSDVAWHPGQWAEFERAFWSYVDGDARPRTAE
jgi:membrane protein implicated in regulation of membrane protease activity